ncbi:MAG: CPBP family intramembrane metalloprotease [Oscillospiraceae bacterium]|nr:CPBP family intramembrane metalloprotease [Oscillospiraceae bacterium]MBR3535206.1 CPBP family intramembrane metalloprotease [Oscillospiraceae bacterium]MBR6837042.1 CPBP family intramembrane metalloprotease [Oscillospiraceae bacterium]
MKEKSTEKKPFATPEQYAFCSVFITIAVFLFSGIMLNMLIDDKLGSNIALAAGGITGVILYLIPNKTLDLKRQLKTFDITVPVMILILNWTACEIASSVYGMIACRFSSIEPDTNDFSSLIAVIGSVIIAPVSEELMFRLCSMGLIKKFKGKTFTIFFTTLIFSLMHCFYSIQGMINVFAGAIFFAVCYYYTENIFYSIIAHMLHNLLCIPDFWDKLGVFKNGYSILKPLPLVVYILIFAAGMFWLVRVFMKKYAVNENISENALTANASETAFSGKSGEKY